MSAASPHACRLAALIAAAMLLAGCGDDEEAAPKPVERKEETAQKLPKLDRGWEEFVNEEAGVAFGRPPGWAAKPKVALTTLDAPDELVSVAITVDRTDEALRDDPKSFATATMKLIEGYEKPLDPGKAKPFGHPYDGAVVEASGKSKQGVPQEVKVIVLERKGAAVVTAIVAANAEEPNAESEVDQALEAVRTLRTRPPR